MLDNMQHRTMTSERGERNEVSLSSPRIIPGESFQTGAQLSESQGECSIVPELKRRT